MKKSTKTQKETKPVETMSKISINSLDRKLKDLDNSSSRKMKKLKDYEPYVIPILAFLIIVGGFASAGFDSNSTPIGFVVIDLTDENSQQQTVYQDSLACRDEWLCTEWSECSDKGIEERECLNFGDCSSPENALNIEQERSCIIRESISSMNLVTGMAAYGEESNVQLLKLLIYIMVIVSMAIMVTYAILAYAMKMAEHHHWAAISYWIAMAGIPFSVYYTVTTKDNIVSAYVAFIFVILAFAVLMVLKPWKPRGLPELNSINNLIEQRSFSTKRDTKYIINSRIKRRSSERNFISRLKLADHRREMQVSGVKDLNLNKLDKEIRNLLKKGDETRRSAEYLENVVRERESRFTKMNSQLKKWAESRRMEKDTAERKRRQAELEKHMMLEKERQMMKKIIETEDKRELEEVDEKISEEESKPKKKNKQKKKSQSHIKKRGAGKKQKKGGIKK